VNRYYYDLHIHSCLSPCGDEDNTPNNIAGMASLCGLNIVALTDHNTTKNCPAFFTAARRHGIIPIAGMELTTSEDIHVVCLFEELDDAMAFGEFVQSKRVLIKNRVEIFGEQTVLDGEDNPIGTEEYFLPNATEISIEDVSEHVRKYRGICYPAHIDRDSNGIIAILGTIPEESDFRLFELRDSEHRSEYAKRYGLSENQFIVSSDAHYLTNMRDKKNYFDIEDEPYSSALVRKELFKILRSI
jgi:PHP family Zn ribbon phosphoesterase